jgi:dihydrofolate reductase
MTISLIAAMGKNRVIGNKGKIPWNLPADLRYFRRTTDGHSVIMGRKTYESIGRPLPNRKNIIITRDKNYKADGCDVVDSLGEALDRSNSEEVFVIGGGEIYKLALPLANKIYLTLVDYEPKGDAFFPEFDLKEWREISREDHEVDNDNSLRFSFINYEKSA